MQIDLDTLMRWVKEVRPRTQDDIGPLLALTRDVLKRMLENRLTLEASREVGLRRENAEVRLGYAVCGMGYAVCGMR